MRPLSLILFLSLFVLLPSFASAEPLTVAVGKRATWLHLETGDQRVEGRRVRKIEIDTALVREKCVTAVAGFDGLVRLRHESRGNDWKVRVECMHRPQPAIASESQRPIGAAARAGLEARTDAPEETS